MNVFGLRIAKACDKKGFVQVKTAIWQKYLEMADAISPKRLAVALLAVFSSGVIFGVVILLIFKRMLKKRK